MAAVAPLTLYKRLLRAHQKAFPNDFNAIKSKKYIMETFLTFFILVARNLTRQRFESSKSLSDTTKISQEIKVGTQVEEILLKHVAQAIHVGKSEENGKRIFRLNVRDGLVLEEQDMTGVPVQRCC